ncbi:hypothetical protein [Rhizobium calliandrae]|uniref:hypothetical protein n=1 Tax=Rhizobium calliandrae TaxID=1312182 RepID=UPI0032E4BF89
MEARAVGRAAKIFGYDFGLVSGRACVSHITGNIDEYTAIALFNMTSTQELSVLDAVLIGIGIFGPTRDSKYLSLSVMADIAASRLASFAL